MRRSRQLGFFGLFASIVGAFVSFGGCGSSAVTATTQCNTNPFQCASGTTCTVSACTCTTPSCTDANCTPHFTCLPSVSTALEGASCKNAVGSASCGDGLACIADMGGMGVCTPYCGGSQACPTGLSCEAKTVQLGSAASYPVIHVCEVPSGDGGIIEVDSGNGGGPPPADAAADRPHFDVISIDSSAK